jgi:hypothetical protein
MLVQTAAINSQRDNYIACLETAEKAAQTQKLAADALDGHLRLTCASAEAQLTSALIAFDVKNKVARKQAAADAKLQIDDFISGMVERYRKIRATERG